MTMDPISQLFVRLAYWLKNPPSRKQVYAGAIAVVVAVVIVGIKRAGYWPKAFHVNTGVPHISSRASS
jgi:hypothetical protein